MTIFRKHMSRRTILRGLGAAVALPVLDGTIHVAGLSASDRRQRRRYQAHRRAAGFPRGQLLSLHSQDSSPLRR